ncbi:gluconate:H+ symporter [Ureibacillus acetophenoni]|uniref:Gnt-I system high-affinity gluconate transporter n=1 Tax=Ureibacillus acetophenoni TaxID=614649 RepID=A0A285U4G4_9BACL|nr:gluconate:H+ symporter [Ureibacillus acetophenoni]SOC36603.1 Gnt-I system high-affinity gluconate transporter [Ureibacillus acetophenoni]
MSIVSIILGVTLLLLLMMVLRLNAFLAFIIASLFVGILEGMSPTEAMTSIQNGLGSTLGSITMIIIFGAVLGKLITDSGAAKSIAVTMLNAFGKKHVQFASVFTASVVGIALFFETGVVVLVPLVFTISLAAGVPILYIGIPVITALITMHGFVPPHPGPTAIAEIFNANLGETLIWGVIIAIPPIIIAGPLFTKVFKKEDLEVTIPKELYNPIAFGNHEIPSFTVSILTAILPVILIAIKSLVEIISPNSPIRPFTDFIGTASTALLISVIVAMFTLGIARGKGMKKVMNSFAKATAGIALILLIISGGGAFKQVLIDSEIDQYIAGLMEGTALSPILLVWVISAVLRIALGSATVAGMTAAGIAAPIVAVTGANPELMTLAAGAGSVGFSHVNDAGFWIVKEYFNMSIGKTFKTWTVLTSIVSIVGLFCIIVLDMFI